MRGWGGWGGWGGGGGEGQGQGLEGSLGVLRAWTFCGTALGIRRAHAFAGQCAGLPAPTHALTAGLTCLAHRMRNRKKIRMSLDGLPR